MSSQVSPRVPRVDAVLLDAGGVLILPAHDAVRAILAPYGVRPSDSDLARAHYAGIAARQNAEASAWEPYDRAYVRACGVADVDVEDAAKAASAGRPRWSSAIEGVKEQLWRLAGLGVELAVVSNAAGTVESELGVAGVCQVGEGAGVPVRAVVDSFVVGFYKPDPAIFQLGLDAVGVPADRALMVGDYVHADVEGARRAGIPAVHLDPHGDCTSDHGGSPDVRSLADVVELVAASRRPPATSE